MEWRSYKELNTMKIWSTSLIIWEMPNKTTIKYASFQLGRIVLKRERVMRDGENKAKKRTLAHC